MASEQSMAQAIMSAAVETAEVVIMTVRGRNYSQQCETSTNSAKNRWVNSETANNSWKPSDKYADLCNFEIEVKKTFLASNYNILESQNIPILMNWLGHRGFRFVQTLRMKNKTNAKPTSRLFEVLIDKYKTQQNYTLIKV